MKKIKDIFENVGNKVIKYCPKCKTKTPHTYHGFMTHNYREVCMICKNLNYVEYD